MEGLRTPFSSRMACIFLFVLLSEILKKGGLVVNQSVVLLMKCVQVQFFATQESGRNFFYFVAKNCVNGIASNPPFLKLRQALMRYPQPLTAPIEQ